MFYIVFVLGIVIGYIVTNKKVIPVLHILRTHSVCIILRDMLSK